MAGITFLYRLKKTEPLFTEKLEKKLDKLNDVHILLQEHQFLVVKKTGKSYPVQLVNQHDYTIIIEGRIYGINVLNDTDFARHTRTALFNENKEESLRYLRNLDGEFVIYLVDKSTKKVVIINDYLGRLPLYYTRNGHFIIGRDIGLIHKISGGLKFSESGVYQFMRLGYPLGNKTLFRHLYRLPPSCCVELDAVGQGKVKMQANPVSLKELHDSGEKNKHPEEQLYAYFKRAVAWRLASDERVVLSLSGGLDSRIIMGEIEKRGHKVSYESFHYDHAIIDADVRIVQQLCRHYKKQFGLAELKEWAPEYFEELINIKSGMNYLGMAFLIPFLKNMSANYHLMLTGDGGDKTLPYMFPDLNLLGGDRVGLILSQNEVTSKKACAQLFGAAVIKQEEKIKAYVHGFVERESKWAYKQFLISERTKNWLFEGEDRNRNYIWSTSPFYSPEFFRAVHAINEHDKKDYRLYKSFTALIDPALNNITNANWGMPVTDRSKLKFLLTKQAVKQHAQRLFPLRNTAHTALGDLREQVGALLDKGVAVPPNLNKNMDVRVLSNESLFHLLTLFQVAERLGISAS